LASLAASISAKKCLTYTGLMGRFAGTDTISLIPEALKIT
jgi:hypothetical protein